MLALKLLTLRRLRTGVESFFFFVFPIKRKRRRISRLSLRDAGTQGQQRGRSQKRQQRRRDAGTTERSADDREGAVKREKRDEGTQGQQREAQSKERKETQAQSKETTETKRRRDNREERGQQREKQQQKHDARLRFRLSRPSRPFLRHCESR